MIVTLPLSFIGSVVNYASASTEMITDTGEQKNDTKEKKVTKDFLPCCSDEPDKNSIGIAVQKPDRDVRYSSPTLNYLSPPPDAC